MALVCPDYPDESTCYVPDSPQPEVGSPPILQFPYIKDVQPRIVDGVPVFSTTVTEYQEALPCVTGSGPLRPGQEYCADSDPNYSSGRAPAPPQKTNWLMWALIAAGVVLLARRQ